MLQVKNLASAGFLLAWRAAVHVEVKMLRVLVSTEVRQDSAPSVFSFYIRSNLSNDVHDVGQRLVGRVAEVGQGGDVALRDHDDVDRPERLGVVERQDVLGLDHDVDRSSSANGLVTVKVIAHAR